jgi:hypothetical protein
VSRVDEQVRQWRVHSVTNESAHAGGVVLLPSRICCERYGRRPAGNGTCRKGDGVANRFVAAAAPVEHARQHRHIEVRVIVYPHLSLTVVEAVQPSGVLGDGPAPRHRKREHQRVQARVVEPFAHVLAGRQEDAFLIRWNRRELIGNRRRCFRPIPPRNTSRWRMLPESWLARRSR